jgi:ABC-type lipopolysaccharide export system ATPase subunit
MRPKKNRTAYMYPCEVLSYVREGHVVGIIVPEHAGKNVTFSEPHLAVKQDRGRGVLHLSRIFEDEKTG